MDLRTLTLIIAYLITIIAANLLVATFGPAASIPIAFVLIGCDFVVRDRLHDTWQDRGLTWRMAALIVCGSLLSYALNAGAGRIALASCAAFAAAGVADALVYHALRRRSWAQRANGSNVVGAAIDSIAFLWLAFGVGALWFAPAQFVAKVAGGAVWAALLRGRKERAPV